MSDCQKHPDGYIPAAEAGTAPLDDTLTDVPSPAPCREELEQREGALSLYQKLHALPEPYREVFWLRVYGELTFAEIAALHHKTESWARVTFTAPE